MKRLSIIFLAALAATPITSEASPVLKAAIPFAAGTLLTGYSYNLHIEGQETFNEWYNAYQKAESKAKELIQEGKLTVPANCEREHFIWDVIRVACTPAGNILANSLDSETLNILKGDTRRRAYSAQELSVMSAFLAAAAYLISVGYFCGMTTNS